MWREARKEGGELYHQDGVKALASPWRPDFSVEARGHQLDAAENCISGKKNNEKKVLVGNNAALISVSVSRIA